jgi:hypothetical protein
LVTIVVVVDTTVEETIADVAAVTLLKTVLGPTDPIPYRYPTTEPTSNRITPLVARISLEVMI